MRNTPIIYTPGWIEQPTELFATLWNELPFIRHDKVPRRECYFNDVAVPYTYGTAPFARTYTPAPDWHPAVRSVQKRVEAHLGQRMEVCFLNGYEDGTDQLGWHEDDSPEMDPGRAIAIISLGAEREIWFRPNEAEAMRRVKAAHGNSLTDDDVKRLFLLERTPEKVALCNGSLCIMQPGMQQTHQHRIPKSHVHACGPRISFTFRGYIPVL
jgi:alkylated DNA repair dioxygenase AlkB